ncbi:MAG: mechanosensitive ion channel family protein, partial [Pseudohongiella sp.]|nr:mechanosensitive ion channel family protein [Pseudohongiella sp.]
MESLLDLNLSTDMLLAMSISYGPRLLGSIVSLILGLWLVNIVIGMIRRMLSKSKVDPSLASFLSSLFNIL